LRLPTVEWTWGRIWACYSSRFWKWINESEITDGKLGNLLKETLNERRSEFKIADIARNLFLPNMGTAKMYALMR
jgi:hypothetical protein